MRPPAPADHFMAVVEALRGAGMTVGEGHGRDNFGNPLEGDHVVVTSTSGSGGRGPVGAPHDDMRLEFQTMCVSGSARGAEVLRGTVAETLLAGLPVDGRGTYVWRDLSVGVRRDPDVAGLFTGIDRWSVWTTPA